jgi:hypothetical protein
MDIRIQEEEKDGVNWRKVYGSGAARQSDAKITVHEGKVALKVNKVHNNSGMGGGTRHPVRVGPGGYHTVAATGMDPDLATAIGWELIKAAAQAKGS